MSVDIHEVITCATFCDDRLRGSGWQGVEFPVFPLTCVVALTTLSHYRASVWFKSRPHVARDSPYFLWLITFLFLVRLTSFQLHWVPKAFAYLFRIELFVLFRAVSEFVLGPIPPPPPPPHTPLDCAIEIVLITLHYITPSHKASLYIRRTPVGQRFFGSSVLLLLLLLLVYVTCLTVEIVVVHDW